MLGIHSVDKFVEPNLALMVLMTQPENKRPCKSEMIEQVPKNTRYPC